MLFGTRQECSLNELSSTGLSYFSFLPQGSSQTKEVFAHLRHSSAPRHVQDATLNDADRHRRPSNLEPQRAATILPVTVRLGVGRPTGSQLRKLRSKV